MNIVKPFKSENKRSNLYKKKTRNTPDTHKKKNSNHRTDQRIYVNPHSEIQMAVP